MNATDLRAVTNLLQYLADHFSTGDLRTDVVLIDSNGETAGRVEFVDQEYRLVQVR